jgi:hypothetical protein
LSKYRRRYPQRQQQPREIIADIWTLLDGVVDKLAALEALTKRESGAAEAAWNLDQIGIEGHCRRHRKMPTDLQLAAEKALAQQTTLFDPENKVQKLLERSRSKGKP